ncbi:MAG: DUF4296 domain-containing protein [Bacteroidales bacterium]
MKNSHTSHIIRITGTIIMFLLILSVSFACRDKSKVNLIPEKKFTQILYDSYLADGLLMMPSIRDKFSKKDTVSCYIDIIKSYGYSYEEMQRTLNYYFKNDPKKLVSIYDKIAENLNAEELKITTEIQKLTLESAEKARKGFHFLLPDPELKEKPGFSYDITGPGLFTLEFSVTVFPDDQSYHPFFSAWYSDADGPDAGKRKYFPEISYIKDGWPHTYMVKGRIEGNKRSVLKGFYFDYGNNPDFSRQHAEIMNLNFSFMCDAK